MASVKRERKPQTGATNLVSSRSESSLGAPSPQPQAATPKTKGNQQQVTRAWAHTMISPDEYKAKEAEGRPPPKLTATWKPAEIHKRNFHTVYSDSYRVHEAHDQHSMEPKSMEQIAAENLAEGQRREAVDNMCKLVRTSYGTVATMLRSFQKKSTDSLTLYEFEKYIKRNNLDPYLPEDERKLVFDYVDPRHGGTVPVRDFLKKVEEREFCNNEHNKEHQQLKDFLEFHLQLKRSQQLPQQQTGEGETGSTSSGAVPAPARTSSPGRTRRGGIDNEVDRMRKALGMRTFGLDVSHEELDDVVTGIFHKLPTNEVHRKYARFLHHSQLNLAAIPFYDFRSREIERLKDRSMRIEKELTREGLKEEYETLRSTMLRGSLAVSQSLPALPTMSASDWSDAAPSPSPSPSTHVIAVRPSPLAGPVTNSDGTASLPSHGTFNLNQSSSVPRLESLTQPLPSLPAIGGGDGAAAPKPKPAQQQPQAAAQKTRSIVLSHPDHVAQHLVRGSSLHEDHAGGGGGGGGGGGASVSTGSSYLDLLIDQPPPSAHGPRETIGHADDDFETSSMNSGAVPQLAKKKNIIVASQKKALSKLVNKSHATQDHMRDFYGEVITPSQSMGRTKDPNKVMRIEKTDFTATSMSPSKGPNGGRKVFEDRLQSDDGSRVGLGHHTGYFDRPPPSEVGGSDFDSLPSHYQASYASSPSLRSSHSQVSVAASVPVVASEFLYQPEDQFRSVASMQFPPLIYEPSQPVRRDVQSQAALEASKREYRRKERYARTAANMAVTSTRLEYDQLQAQLRQLHRNQGRVEDAIRYKTSIFLDDLQHFRQQPLQRMAKRQNMDLADKIFGGNMEKQTVGLVKESRTFETEYRTHFEQGQTQHHTQAHGQSHGHGHAE